METESSRARSGGVQSVERAFGLLETMADHGGSMGLSQLATASQLPLPTIHRIVRTLVDLGYLRQEPSRRYALGPRLIRLGESSSTMLSTWARPQLTHLVDELGESANLAMLDGDQIVYVAQVPSRHSMRMFTEVGRRVWPHCTAVGKAVLATLPERTVREMLQRTGLPQQTEHTITDAAAFGRELALTADRGYALDDGEQELGVRCVAVVVPDAPSRLGLSVSGPSSRVTDDVVARAVPLLTRAARDLSEELNGQSRT
ncbi:IclR family transcriptional regulator [Jiangella sp. DSM 45060]|uniref:IclR family transcriptional regulator n=1 Tax=Jiangella sp. DSM 45060 TaxID=1798224 RepID=UPI00087C5292|nr:IclR family transcriptional regulator [Jiangella sp. DSM 45060]SDT67235.1 transcriptional regulator, IclR family [Jiangella sp. DSM 45060]